MVVVDAAGNFSMGVSMSGLEPEEKVLSFDTDEYINYCDSCCAMEYQPHCYYCFSSGNYDKKVSIFDEDTIDILLDSYYNCLVVSEKLKNSY